MASDLRRISKNEARVVMWEAVMSLPNMKPGEAQAIALLNRLATLGYVVGKPGIEPRTYGSKP